MIEEHHLSERRACRLVGLSRDSYRHPPQPDAQTTALQGKIVEIAQVRRRFGYRRIHDLLRPEFPGVNHKRVYRLYSEARLAVRKRKKVRRPMGRVACRVSWPRRSEVRSMDFVGRQPGHGLPTQVLDLGRRLRPRVHRQARGQAPSCDFAFYYTAAWR